MLTYKDVLVAWKNYRMATLTEEFGSRTEERAFDRYFDVVTRWRSQNTEKTA